MLLKLSWKMIRNAPRLFTVGAGAGIAWSALVVDHNLPLHPPLDGSQWSVDDGGGGMVRVYFHDTGEGHPVLLVHSVNAAASAYEMRPLYQGLWGTRPVWALDLPGFGLSDRGNRRYTPESMGAAIANVIERIPRPVHLVALSLGAEFAARATLLRPDLVVSFAAISPTGFGSLRPARPVIGTLLRFPPWSQALFDAVSSRASITYFLGKSFAGPVDPAMVDYAYRTSHQLRARFAPLAFLAGELFSEDAATELYSHLKVPALVLYDRDPFTSFIRLPEFLPDHPNWTATRIADTNGLPHWDRPAETLEALRSHWEESER